jgi:hypothetical protein
MNKTLFDLMAQKARKFHSANLYLTFVLQNLLVKLCFWFHIFRLQVYKSWTLLFLTVPMYVRSQSPTYKIHSFRILIGRKN